MCLQLRLRMALSGIFLLSLALLCAPASLPHVHACEAVLLLAERKLSAQAELKQSLSRV